MSGADSEAGAASGKRVFVAGLLQESNTFSPRPSSREDFFTATGDAMLDRIAATEVFRRAGIVPVPSLFAYAVPGGPLAEADFLSFHDEIVAKLEPGAIDGVWLYLHGALEVERIGSGEAALVASIRKRVGPGVPIAVALDFHANNTEELVQAANIVYGYRTAPHVDTEETQCRAAELLVEAIGGGFVPEAAMVRPPMLFPGEMATTPVEPLRSLMREVERAEDVPGVMCASFFDGMAWVDAPHSRASVVVVERPGAGAPGVALREARRLARRFWDRRHEFDFEEETAEPEDAIDRAIASREGPVFIADSGDNFTAGAPGDSVWYLRVLLQRELPPTLVAGIACARAVAAAFAEAEAVETEEAAGSDSAGSHAPRRDAKVSLSLDLGGELDPQGERMTVEAQLLWHGRVLDKSGARNTRAIAVRCLTNPAVDAIITEGRVSFTSPAIVESAGVAIADYKIIVVKLGYLFDGLRGVAKRSIMAFTPGSACQMLAELTYRRVIRPVYPLDRDCSWPEYEEE